MRTALHLSPIGPLLAAVLAWSLPVEVQAQNERALEMQLFLPTAATGTSFTVDRPGVVRHLNVSFGLAANYALEPLNRTEQPGYEGGPIVRHLAQFEALAALGLFEYLELGVAVPVALIDSSPDPYAPSLSYQTDGGMGDVRLSAKVPLLRGDFGLALRVMTHLPSGDANNFLSMDYWILTPSVLMAFDPGPLRVAVEVGWRFRVLRNLGNLEQDDELLVASGLSVPVIDELEIIAEAQARFGICCRQFDPGTDLPVELDAGLRFWPTSQIAVEVAAGRGVTEGWGAPAFRGFASVRYRTEQQECAAGPEDFDGYQDGDFCADPDNDDDGIPDERDECPNNPEDVDRFADSDGCPDTDNDADGVPDAQDNCPTQSEDRDGFGDEDGCPEPDNDGDGVADGVDQCPMEPEDLDNFQDDDGCPEPGPNAASVTVTDTRILISERIYFDYDRDTIRSVSMPMLNQVARVIRELPSNVRVRVEGYSDNEGLEAYNIDLSYRRARAVVEYLVGRGVSRRRIEYRGYGPRNPVAPNDTPEGRALNRRVEFTILNRGESRRR